MPTVIRNQAAYDAAVARNAGKKFYPRKKKTYNNCTCPSKKKTYKKKMPPPFLPPAGLFPDAMPSFPQGFAAKSKPPPFPAGNMRDNPIVQNVLAHISPQKCANGSVSGMYNAMPSQKFTSRGLISLGVGNGETSLVFINPCVANDSTRPSLVAITGTIANLGLVTSTFTSSTAAVSPASTILTNSVTNTPYAAALLDDGNYHWRCVSAFVRVRYQGAAQYQSGIIKYYDDLQGHILENSELSSITLAAIIGRIDAHTGTIRKSLNQNPVAEFNVAGGDLREANQGAWTQGLNPLSLDWSNQRIGGTASTLLMGQPASYMTITNSTGFGATLDIEMIEHWEVRGTAIEMLHTPSTAHDTARSAVVALANSARQHHAANPAISFGSACKFVSKTLHNKAAMAGVEDVLMSALSLA